jgi:hypothetical protein
MEPPIAPSLREFGLTDKVYVALPTPWGPSAKLETRIMAVGIGAQVLVISVLTKSVVGGIVSILFPIPGVLSAFFVMFSVKRLRESYLVRTNHLYKQATSYRNAMAKYAGDKAVYEQWLFQRRKEFWLSLTGHQFEDELARLFGQLGYEVNKTPVTGDGGVDLLLKQNGRLTIVQCKAHGKKISIAVAREVSACLADFKAHAAIIACFHGATKPVTNYIVGKPITILDADAIAKLQQSVSN